MLFVLIFRWSDIYYIPRKFFRDFIDLANIFYAFSLYHEVAVPTMLNIIDLTHRLTPFHTILTRLSDCWGHCCTDVSAPSDIKGHRCGHKINLSQEQLKNTLIELLELEATYLSKS